MVVTDGEAAPVSVIAPAPDAPANTRPTTSDPSSTVAVRPARMLPFQVQQRTRVDERAVHLEDEDGVPSPSEEPRPPLPLVSFRQSSARIRGRGGPSRRSAPSGAARMLDGEVSSVYTNSLPRMKDSRARPQRYLLARLSL